MGQYLSPLLEKALSISGINETYRNSHQSYQQRPETSFFDYLLEDLDIRIKISEGSLSAIPESGPVIIVSNHPFGGIDGILLGSLLTKQRPDARLLANSLLGRIPELAPHLIQVNPFGGKHATRENLRGVREAHRWLDAGSCLITFPAGTVCHFQPPNFSIEDSPWHATTGWLARKHQAGVHPPGGDRFNVDVCHVPTKIAIG